MSMQFDLNSLAVALAKQVADNELKVSAVQDYGDKIVVVFVPKHVVDRSVTLVDLTKPVPVQVPAEKVVEKVEVDVVKTETRYDEDGRVVVSMDSRGKPTEVKCQFCDEVFAARGVTRHENKCPLRK